VLIDVKVPILAESVADATLMNWYKKPGDTVQRGDSLIEIETDKVTLEVAAMSSGTLVEILKGDGETVASDEVIARIDTKPAAPGPQAVPDSAQSHKPPQAAAQEQKSIPQQQSLPVGEIPIPDLKLSPAVRKLLQEHRLNAADIPAASGERLTKEDVLAFLEGSAGTAAVEQQAVPPATPSPGRVQATRPAAKEPKAEPVAVVPAPVAAAPVRAASAKAPAVPVSQTPASAQPRGPEPAASVSAVSPSPEEVPVAGERIEQRVPMTRLRRRAAERLLAAQHENAILTTFNEVNMQPVMDLRKRYREEFERTHGIRLGYMSFFTKAVIEALKKFPVLNASVDGDDIIYHGYYDIGMAVSSPRGLIVPIVRDADQLSFAEIERRIKDFSDRAVSGKLAIEELIGGTFTITNGGIFGSLLSTPIINPPQSAILGMHAIQERPVAVQGEVRIQPMMYVAMSYDHRIIDGREAVQFLVTVKSQLEDPARLLLQL